MKIMLIFSISVALLLISPISLLCTWVVSSPYATNLIAKPYANPFFGSFRLGDRGFYLPGFHIEEVLNFDRIILLCLLLVIILSTNRAKLKFTILDAIFLIFLAALGVSTLYSNNTAQAVRVTIDTFGLCYIVYLIGTVIAWEDCQFRKYLNAVVVLGITLIIVSFIELYTNSSIFMYRITGPFLYWENLALCLAIIFFITLFKYNTMPTNNKFAKISYMLLLILIGIFIFLTYTRTIILSVIVGLLFMGIKGKEILSKNSFAKYCLLVIVLISFVAIDPAILKDTSFYQTRLSKRTDEGRIETYILAMRMFEANPMSGIGLKNYQPEQMKYMNLDGIKDNFRWTTDNSTCHNSYLVLAAETGLMGLIPMILLIIFLYRGCRKYYFLASSRTEKFWALIMLSTTVSYFLSALTFDPFFVATIDNKLYYMCMGITAGRYNRLTKDL